MLTTFAKNLDIIQEGVIAYWLIEQEVFILNFVYRYNKFKLRQDEITAFKNLAYKVIVIELYHSKFNHDFIDIY